MLNNRTIRLTSFFLFGPLCLCGLVTYIYTVTRAFYLDVLLASWPCLILVLIYSARLLWQQLSQKKKAAQFVRLHLGLDYRIVTANVKQSVDGQKQLHFVGKDRFLNNLINIAELSPDKRVIVKSMTRVVPFEYLEQPRRVSARPLAALVKEDKSKQKVPHFWRQEEPKGTCELLSWPRFVVITKSLSDTFLTRFDRDCKYASETWHLTSKEAKEQAEYEYGELLGEWKTIPAELSDPRDILDWLRDKEEF